MKDKRCKIRFQTLGYTVDSGKKLTVFENLACGAILRTREEGLHKALGSNERETHGNRSQVTIERSWFWRFFLVDSCKLLSQVWVGGVSGRRTGAVSQSETSLTITAPFERVRPVAVTDNVLRELRTSLNLGLQ